MPVYTVYVVLNKNPFTGYSFCFRAWVLYACMCHMCDGVPKDARRRACGRPQSYLHGPFAESCLPAGARRRFGRSLLCPAGCCSNKLAGVVYLQEPAGDLVNPCFVLLGAGATS
jgi:hypothetical protein